MKKQKIELVEAVHKARARSTKLLEEQGISTLALILSKTLADVIDNPERIDSLV
ncbi:MAG: hypothetical protein KKG76_00020 [Euryarchaeota archaeon]|nr:hypothetical protein [Euryarchaeota archaeon]MBU4139032.1 hypothetical protein [Euryarchaeota archaeon]